MTKREGGGSGKKRRRRRILKKKKERKKERSCQTFGKTSVLIQTINNRTANQQLAKGDGGAINGMLKWSRCSRSI